MPALSDYVSGTITLTNGSNAFTGTGTGWEAADFREGDTILGIEDHAGVEYVIATIDGNGSGTLTQNWEGATGTYTYRMRYMADGARVTAQARNLIELLGNGNLQALAGLTGPGVPVFNGPHAMTVKPEADFINGVAYNVQVDTLADRDAYDGQSEGFSVLVSDVGDGRSALFSKASNTSGDWTDPAYITGPLGPAPVVQATVDSLPPGSTATVTPTPIAGGVRLDFELPEASGFYNAGVYNLASTYDTDDVVRHNGSSFIALQSVPAGTSPSSAFPPVDTAHWQVLAAKGADGSGTGDVVGPSGAVADRIAVFDGTTGKLIKDGGVTVSQLARDRKTVADLLADTVFSYSAGAGKTLVAPGDFITAQDFRYKVAASDATDTHVETAGGVKLRLLPTTDGCINVEAAGADPSGVADSTNAIIIAAAVANNIDIPLIARGTFKLDGSADITITTDADFSGSVFVCETWSGRFIFGRSQPEVEYLPGHPVVDYFIGSSDLNVCSSRISGWSGLEEVQDSFVIIETDQDFYTFRGEAQKRVELNRVTLNGTIESPLRYSMVGVGVTKVRVFKMEPRRRFVRGLTLDISGNDISNYYVVVSSSLLDIDVRFIQDSAPITNTNPINIWFETCCAVVARVEMQWPNRREPSQYTYNISVQDSYDVDITPHSDGDGWGATGNNQSSRVTFRNGTLSRLDFHHPFRDWLRLRDMTISTWGVLVTALGDLDMDTVTFTQRTNLHINNRGIIRSRSDSGGFADGNLIARNITMVADVNSGTRIDFLRHQNESTGTDKPAGSPINYQWWRSIDIDGLKFKGGGTGQRLVVEPTNVQPTPSCPMSVASVVNIKGVAGAVQIDFDVNKGSAPVKTTGTPFAISVRDSAIDVVSFFGGELNRDLAVLVDGCTGYNSVDGFQLETVAGGKYTVVGGVLRQLDFYRGANPAGNVEVNIKGSTFSAPSGDVIAGPSGLGNVHAVLEDCLFKIGSTSQIPSIIMRAMVLRPTFDISGTHSRFQPVSNDIEGAGTYTLVGSPVVGQELWLEMGYSTGGQLAYVPITIPPVGARVIVPGFQSSVGPELGMLHRTTGTQIVASGSVTFRRLLLGANPS